MKEMPLEVGPIFCACCTRAEITTLLSLAMSLLVLKIAFLYSATDTEITKSDPY